VRWVGWEGSGGAARGERCVAVRGGAACAWAHLVEPLPHHVGLVQVADVRGEQVELPWFGLRLGLALELG